MKEAQTLFESVEYLADRGFHASTIARITGLTKSQVYYRVHALGRQLRSYRDGNSEVARKLIVVTPCVRVHLKAARGKMYRVAPYTSERVFP